MMEMFVMDDCRMAANDVVINNQVLRLVINLDRSPKRLELISKQLADQSLSFERFPAVDGHKLTKGSSSKALFNFAPRELLSITQAKFLCKRLFRVLLKSFPRRNFPG